MTYNYEDGASAGDARYVRLSSVEYPDGRNVFYIYPSSGIGDALSRVEAIAGDAAGATRFAEYAYLGAGTIVSVAHPAVTNGLTLDYNPSGNADGNPNDNYSGWDRFGRIVDQRWTDGAGTADLDRYTYTYDGNSNRTSRTNLVETNGVLDEDYTYDGLNRLVDTNRNGTDLQSWNLDSLGNWSSFTDEGTTETRTHNAANEIQNISSPAVPPEDAVSPEFDAAGNMISGPRPDDPLVRQHYIYDAWNRLVEVRADDPALAGSPGDAIATFEYDGRNYRIGKTVGGVLEAFYYNEGQQLLETQVDEAATEEYVWDNRYIDAPILRATPGEVLYYANDANFNVTALIDAATGNVVERYHYDPYGEVLFMDADWTPRAASAFDNAVLYTGRRLDAETGLFYYRARYYDAQLGRFIHRDPIGYQGGANLYRFVENSPATKRDPLGLSPNQMVIDMFEGFFSDAIDSVTYSFESSWTRTRIVYDTPIYTGNTTVKLSNERMVYWSGPINFRQFRCLCEASECEAEQKYSGFTGTVMMTKKTGNLRMSDIEVDREEIFVSKGDFDNWKVAIADETGRTVTGEYSTIDDGTSQSEIIQTAEKLREDKAWGKVWTTRFNAFMASCVTRCTSLAGQTSTDSDHTGVKNQIPRVNMSMPPGPGGSGPLYH